LIAIGIDPGIITTAVMCVDEDGKPLGWTAHVGEPKAKDDKRSRRVEPERLHKMVLQVFYTVDALHQSYRAEIIAIEEPFCAKGQIALKGYAVFAALCHILYGNYPEQLITVSPNTVKKFVGAHKKMFVAREVQRRWGFSSDDHNVVDAYAIARWAMSQNGK